MAGNPNENPWYLLATLYGEPAEYDPELQDRNRTAWNRYMNPALGKDGLALLAERGQYFVEKAPPFTPEEMQALEKAFAERHRQESRIAGAIHPDVSNAPPNISNLQLIDFSKIKFNKRLQLAGFLFPVRSNFSGATFSRSADFRDVIFAAATFFEGATFSDGCFRNAMFYGPASFEGAKFSSADFQSVGFFFAARFSDVIFSDTADFQNATFSSWANFERAIFSNRISFSATTFHSFLSFVNAKFEGPTAFENANFDQEPPRFFGAKLHEGTVWREVRWPVPSKNTSDAGLFVDAYERLKLEMDKLRKHEDELDFFVLEQKSRRMLVGDWKAMPLPKIFGYTIAIPSIMWSRPTAGLAFALYGMLCDYGRSYIRPLWGFSVTVAIGFIFLYWHFGMYRFGTSLALSFANTLGALGFRKDFFLPELIGGLPGWLKVVAAAQTVAGTILLFLLGLALRNRFRMK